MKLNSKKKLPKNDKTKQPKTISKKSSQNQNPQAISNNDINADNVIALQRTIGNQAVIQLLRQSGSAIQRLPDKKTVITQSSPKGKKTKFGTKYQSIVNSVGDYDNYVDGNIIGSDSSAIADYFRTMLGKLDALEILIQTFLDGEGDKKGGLFGKHKSETRYAYARQLKTGIQKERRIIAKTMVQVADSNFADALEAVGGDKKTIRKFLTSATIGGARFSDLGHTKETGDQNAKRDIDGKIKTVGGGSNKLTVMNQGFFKEDIDTIVDPNDFMMDNLAEMESDNEEIKDQYQKKQNLFNVSGAAGIHDFNGEKEKAHLANRDVAMSRLDQILDAGVIAKSEKVLYKTADGDEKTGVLSVDAGGGGAREAGELGEAGGFTNDETQAGANKVYINNAGLQRHLSKLQLLDNLAFQVDRQNSNYYISFDQTGNVTGITGIDNDMALGLRDDIDAQGDADQAEQYPGLSALVDEELAEKIIALDVDILRVAMADLLSLEEIDALVSRLAKLQTHLGNLKQTNKLLKPNQWDDATALLLRGEGGYFDKLASRVN